MTTVHPEPIALTETHDSTCPCINCALGVPPFTDEPASHGWFAYMNSLPVHTESCRDAGCRGECVPERPSDE